LRHKYFDTVVHGFLSALHAAASRYDTVLFCNGINALACRFVGLFFSGTAVVINVDGLERNRKKWNALGRAAYAISERLSCVLADVVLTDAREIQRYYLGRYQVDAAFIPYGSDLPRPESTSVLDRLGLLPGKYLLYVSRFEPENNPEAVLSGFRQVPGDMKLVLVGSAPYSDGLIARLREMAEADPRVLMPGAIYGDGYQQLLSNAAVYIHATEVGGTHPALVEAMGYARPIVLHETPENREVAGETVLYFKASQPETLAEALSFLSENDGERRRLGDAAYRRAQRDYRWDGVTTSYEELFSQAVSSLK
jgi:glycosyltransferase involved in cell wall biosynthesis